MIQSYDGLANTFLRDNRIAPSHTFMMNRLRAFHLFSYAVICLSFCLALPFSAAAKKKSDKLNVTRRPDFSASKKILKNKVYGNKNLTFYCACPYQANTIDLKNCSYQPAHSRSDRARRLEWEHVVPADLFGSLIAEWDQGHPSCVSKSGKPYKGRRCAKKTSQVFKQIEGDPYNLVPEIGELNEKRGNKPMGLINGEERKYGACDVEVAKDKFEPRDAIRGDIARIYFYMQRQYPETVQLPSDLKTVLLQWSTFDPPDANECARYFRIQDATRLENSVLKDPCKVFDRSIASDTL